MEEENLEQQELVFSGKFWMGKILQFVLAGLLIIGLYFIWNWDTSEDKVAVDTNTDTTQSTTQTPNTGQLPVAAVPTPDPVDAEPAFPFTVTLPEGTSSPEEETVGDTVAYTYTFADNATMKVYTSESPATIPTDISWTYTLVGGNQINVTEKVDTLCTAGTAGCTAQNGQYEITAFPADGTNAELVVFIVDPNVTTKTIEAVATEYEAIVNSIRISQ